LQFPPGAFEQFVAQQPAVGLCFVAGDVRIGGVGATPSVSVPWPEPVPAPGASNVMMAVFRSLPLADRMNPDVARLTANTGKSAVRVAIACNDALFVLILLFMTFSSRVPRENRVSFKPETGEVISADAHCDPVPECLGRFGCTAIFVGTDSKPTSQDFSIRTLTHMGVKTFHFSNTPLGRI
jgi:hypothetical protein